VRLRLLAVAAAALVFATPAHAGAPAVSARAYFVVNPATGEVLAQRRAWARVPIASITKLMTVIVALDHAKLTDVVRVQREAAEVGESTINLHAGEHITVGDLVKGALIQSANDAADALADYVGRGSEAAFVRMMNAKASELGLARTHFARPDGLDASNHYSTALDVTRLAETAMRDPRIRAVVRERTASISGGRRLHTWNDLLGVFGGCTASRPVTRRPRAGARSRQCGGTAPRSTRPCSAARHGRSGTPTLPRCCAGASRATGRRGWSPHSACT
jgi:D-alanyl-D-alanine carboxypeptidase